MFEPTHKNVIRRTRALCITALFAYIVSEYIVTPAVLDIDVCGSRVVPRRRGISAISRHGLRAPRPVPSRLSRGRP
jgi:hypothetical protein